MKKLFRLLFGNDISDWVYAGMAYFTVVFLLAVCVMGLRGK